MNSKIYRCGWCGTPTNLNGETLSGEAFKKAVKILENYGDNKTHKTHGDCCINEQMQASQINYVTRDMAIDAGDPSLEGQRI